MSDPVKGLQLEEASMRLLSRLGDARFELTNGTRERAYAEVVAAEVDASEVTEALAKTRAELVELRAENERMRAVLGDIEEAMHWAGTENDTSIYWRFSRMASAGLGKAQP